MKSTFIIPLISSCLYLAVGLKIPLNNFEDEILAFSTNLNIDKTATTAPSNFVYKKTKKVMIVPNACTSILWLDEYFEKFFKDSKTKTKVTIDLGMGNRGYQVEGQWTKIQLSHGAKDTPDHFDIPLEIFITTTPKISDNVDGIIGLAPCGVRAEKYKKDDKEFPIWSPKSVHYQLGLYLKTQYPKKYTNFTTDIVRLEWQMKSVGENTGISGSTNGYLYINENVQDKSMNLTSESSIAMYDITSKAYNINTLPNVPMFFDLELGDIIDDSIVGEMLIANKYSELKSNVTLNLVRTYTELPGSLQVYLYNNFLAKQCFTVQSDPKNDRHRLQTKRSKVQCTCSGTSVPGMPQITFRKELKEKFQFDSSSYFIYRPTQMSTTQSSSWLGLIYNDNDYKLSTEDPREKNMKFIDEDKMFDQRNYRFGMQFVQQYGLRIEYTNIQNRGIWTARVYTGQAKSVIMEGNMGAIYGLLAVVVVICGLYWLFLMKTARLAKEGSLLFRAYNSMENKKQNGMNKKFGKGMLSKLQSKSKVNSLMSGIQGGLGNQLLMKQKITAADGIKMGSQVQGYGDKAEQDKISNDGDKNQ